MDYFDSFIAAKRGKGYMVYVYHLHPDGDMMVFQIDTGASINVFN